MHGWRLMIGQEGRKWLATYGKERMDVKTIISTATIIVQVCLEGDDKLELESIANQELQILLPDDIFSPKIARMIKNQKDPCRYGSFSCQPCHSF